MGNVAQIVWDILVGTGKGAQIDSEFLARARIDAQIRRCFCVEIVCISAETLMLGAETFVFSAKAFVL